MKLPNNKKISLSPFNYQPLHKVKRMPNLAVSPNKEYLAIITSHTKNNYKSSFIHIFDARTMQFLYDKKINEHKKDYFEFIDLTINNKGNIYTLGELNKRGSKNDAFEIAKINKTEIKLNKILHKDDSKHLTALKIKEKNGKLSLIGFYSKKNSYGIKGVSIIKVDKNDLTILDTKDTEIPIIVFEDLFGINKAKRKSKKELEGFDLNHVIEDNLGNTYIIGRNNFYLFIRSRWCYFLFTRWRSTRFSFY